MPSFKIIGLLVLKKNIFKGFSIYSHGGHFGQVTLTINTNFRSPSTNVGLNAALIGHAVAEKMFRYYSHIHVYIPQAEADNHLGLNIFIKIKLPICIIIASFHLFNYI